ncbi:proteasome chaperone 3/4 [Scheffersomyces amazonensis]|uniref:proteasome chaperone 3/4 n=1 Tax=Scheffersomyces amazonensis TaxID=1078765 RepID=UPI00315D7A5E
MSSDNNSELKSTGEILTDPTGFTKSFVTHYKEDTNTEILFHKLELGDQIIINIQFNGIMDTTFELPLSSKSTVNFLSSIPNSLDDPGVEPVLLVGNHSNLKISIIASQIGKLITTSNHPKPAILSIGSKWFGKFDETTDDDFDKLMFILENIKKLL